MSRINITDEGHHRYSTRDALTSKLQTLHNMSTTTMPALYEFTDTIPYRPAISVLMSLEHSPFAKETIKQSAKQATEKVERHLLEHYPGEMVLLMTEKLRRLTGSINYNSNKKSVAVYLSPLFEKIIYLNIPVIEFATVDESFDIRDIISNKKQSKEYLVLQITEEEYRIYHGKENTLRLIVDNSAGACYASHKNILNEVSAKDNGIMAVRNQMQEHFLKHAANAIDILLAAYRLPVFITGQKDSIDYFQKIADQITAVIDLICTQRNIADKEEIAEILKPYTSDWERVRHTILKNLVREAASKQKLTTGIKAVWQEALAHKGKLLIVERNFVHPAGNNTGNGQLSSVVRYCPASACAFNLVDDIIEKILESGGDVELVEDGCLECLDHIALIQ